MPNLSRLVGFVGFISLALCAQGQETVSPMEIAGATTIASAKAKELFERGAIFVDVRSDKDWDAGRIPGAQHLEFRTEFSAEKLGAIAGREQEVVFYCDGPKCPLSAEAAQQALGWGYRKVYYFREGFPAWQTSGYPVE